MAKSILYLVTFMKAITLALTFNMSHTLRQSPGERRAKNESLKYIWIWPYKHQNRNKYYEYNNEGHGLNIFISNKCDPQNCFLTTNQRDLPDIESFDAVLFHEPTSTHSIIEKRRSNYSNQKYIFHSIEASDRYPLTDRSLDDFFNITWTYKLNSDIKFTFILIQNKENKIIGPKKKMHWKKIENMSPVTEDIKAKLAWKFKTAAWVVSNCGTTNRREQFVNHLQVELKTYGLQVDIFGKCTFVKCMPEDCWEMIEREYYFYLSFESVFSDDYVTDQLLNPLMYYTVPIVYGGANYTRFMPEGIYLDAHELGVKRLAREMSEIMNTPDRYYSFFKWHNHYSYHNPQDSPNTNTYCKLCKYLNNKKEMETIKQYKYFRTWWNCDPRGVKHFNHVYSNDTSNMTIFPKVVLSHLYDKNAGSQKTTLN